MNSVAQIYREKLNTVQQKLQSVAGRTGVTPPSFYTAYQEAITATAPAADPETMQETEVQPAAVNTGLDSAPVSVRASAYDGLVQRAASTYDMDENIIKAVIQAESSFRQYAVSESGAQGLMQLKPGTASGLGVENSFDPEENIMGGTAYLKKQLDYFGDIRLALAAYNTGPSAIRAQSATEDGKYAYEKLTAEEQRYVNTVFAYYNTFENATK